jgi:serine/threonine protein kinase
MTTNLVGTSLGAYRLAQEIGSGGLATVYKAYQPNLERWVAVKVLDYQDRESLLRFQREAQAIAQLRHRNIIIVYDYGQEQEWPYIAMEYIEGGTLEDRLFGQPLDWIKAVDLLLPITDALGYAHTQGIIHRDVKPSNILLPQEDWPLLADFGLVKLINSGDDDDDVEEITGPGTAMGTPSYLSPEQARGMPLDYRADIYSLGVLLYEMVTGRLPFTYENPS